MTEELTRQVLDHGYVQLLDWMPRNRNAELAIVEAARVSTGADRIKTELTNADKRLIRRLFNDQHTSPFEMVELKFVVHAPIFVARQWFRHRTGSYNEQSGRYSKLNDVFYMPDVARSQHKTNKQMSGDEVLPDETQQRFTDYLAKSTSVYDEYSELCDLGVAREQARMGLSLNLYTKFYFKIDLHNFLKFSKLRMAEDAQYEIRVYADAMFDMVKQICPVTCGAFLDSCESITLTKQECEELRHATEGGALLPDSVLKKLGCATF